MFDIVAELQKAIETAYRDGYSDGLMGRAPKHPPDKIASTIRRSRAREATSPRRRGRPAKSTGATIAAKRAPIGKRGRLPKRQAETWIKESMTGEWQKPKDIAAAIQGKAWS